MTPREEPPPTRESDPTEVMRLVRFLDIEMELAVEIGRKTLTLGDLLRLQRGSLIELSARVEEPLHVLVNGFPLGLCDLVPASGNGVQLRIVELQDQS